MNFLFSALLTFPCFMGLAFADDALKTRPHNVEGKRAELLFTLLQQNGGTEKVEKDTAQISLEGLFCGRTKGINHDKCTRDDISNPKDSFHPHDATRLIDILEQYGIPSLKHTGDSKVFVWTFDLKCSQQKTPEPIEFGTSCTITNHLLDQSLNPGPSSAQTEEWTDPETRVLYRYIGRMTVGDAIRGCTALGFGWAILNTGNPQFIHKDKIAEKIFSSPLGPTLYGEIVLWTIGGEGPPSDVPVLAKAMWSNRYRYIDFGKGGYFGNFIYMSKGQPVKSHSSLSPHNRAPTVCEYRPW